ncbi:hypothetical protein GCM10027168_63520 [Streptomyces capparidis]
MESVGLQGVAGPVPRGVCARSHRFVPERSARADHPAWPHERQLTARGAAPTRRAVGRHDSRALLTAGVQRCAAPRTNSRQAIAASTTSLRAFAGAEAAAADWTGCPPAKEGSGPRAPWCARRLGAGGKSRSTRPGSRMRDLDE